MKKYIIKTPYYSTTRKRRDAAAFVFLDAVYQALEADGQLDTKAGHNVYNACKQMANDVKSGAYAMFDFSHPLPHNAGLVQFSCEA